MCFFFSRPQQARQPGTGGQGAGAGQRSGQKEPLQPANIPVAKSKTFRKRKSNEKLIFLFSIKIEQETSMANHHR